MRAGPSGRVAAVKVCYLDSDDEITRAIARVPTTEEPQVAIVLPAGSEVATGSIDCRVLARGTQTSGRTVVIVRGDADVHALAVAAGLLAYGTVDEAEESLGRRGAPGGPDRGGIG